MCVDCTDLAVFKAVLGRTRDWADIEAMAEVGTIDAGRALGWVGDLIGVDDQAYERLTQALSPARPDEREAYRRAFGPPSDDRGD